MTPRMIALDDQHRVLLEPTKDGYSLPRIPDGSMEDHLKFAMEKVSWRISDPEIYQHTTGRQAIAFSYTGKSTEYESVYAGNKYLALDEESESLLYGYLSLHRIALKPEPLVRQVFAAGIPMRILANLIDDEDTASVADIPTPMLKDLQMHGAEPKEYLEERHSSPTDVMRQILADLFPRLDPDNYPEVLVAEDPGFVATTRYHAATDSLLVVVDSRLVKETPEKLRQALTHEAIHCWIYSSGETDSSHGDLFKKISDYVNSRKGDGYVGPSADDMSWVAESFYSSTSNMALLECFIAAEDRI